MCVEGCLKQEKIQGCWFVDGKVPSIRMQVKWETFFLISFLNNDSAIGLVIFDLNLPNGQVFFLGEIQITEGL